MIGLPVIVTVSVPPAALSAHDALPPQTTSPTVCEFPGGQLGGPLDCDAGSPQSESVKRIVAMAERTIGSSNTTWNSSPVSIALAKPSPLVVCTADVDFGPVVSVEVATTWIWTVPRC